jgi:hypothetical protein
LLPRRSITDPGEVAYYVCYGEPRRVVCGPLPERVGKMVLVTPSTMAVGITATSEVRREVVRRREGEPWFGQVSAAFEAIAAGQGTDDDSAAIVPFTYGRWDAAARAHHAGMDQRRNAEVAAAFGAEGAFDPMATCAALATFGAPVQVLAGELDLAAPPRVVADSPDCSRTPRSSPSREAAITRGWTTPPGSPRPSRRSWRDGRPPHARDPVSSPENPWPGAVDRQIGWRGQGPRGARSR